MLIAAYVLVPLASAVLLFFFLWWIQTRLFMSLVKERLVITLKNGETFEGLLIEHDRKVVKLVEARALTISGGGNPSAPIDGELYLIRSEVNYMQRPGHSADINGSRHGGGR
jgi:small nuclear ribonucleoprotein (snRNP)-like protein